VRRQGLLHSRCSLRDKGDVSLLKLHGVQTSSVAAVATLSRAAAPEWILTRPPTVTACRGRHFAPRVKQTLFRCIPTARSFANPSRTFPTAASFRNRIPSASNRDLTTGLTREAKRSQPCQLA